MIWAQVALLVLAAATAAVLTWLVRRHALSRGFLDHPNARSSHSLPTPRGGGLSIVIVVSLAVVLMICRNAMERALLWAILPGGLAVAAVGYLDDRNSLSARTRFVVHVASAAWAVFLMDGLPTIQWGGASVHIGIWGSVLAVISIVWMLNLFNFMDGIDGIAASESVFIASAGAGLSWLVGVPGTPNAVAAVLAAASLGFLRWNWPQARIFMGDVGSGYLGYVIAVIALAAARASPVALWVWLILAGVFFIDATVTLVRRISRGERASQAHRSHAYQWLARRWRSHRNVTLCVMAVNVLWLLPCAFFATVEPGHASWIALLALVPLVGAALLAGAGQPETAG